MIFALWAGFSCLVDAQEVYFRNKPFSGPTSGSWDKLLVGLTETAKIFELVQRQEAGAYIVGTPPDSPASSGQVVVNGVVVTAEPGESGPLVNLREFAEAAGLTYKVNREFGGIDVTKPVAKAGASAATVNEGGGGAIELNKDTPGALLDLESLRTPGVVTLFYMYKANEKDKGYKASYDQVDVFANRKGVVLYKINVGSKDSPLGLKYPGMLPRLETQLLKNRRTVAWNGHSISQATKSPDSFLNDIRTKY
jgi:hypothetical protein